MDSDEIWRNLVWFCFLTNACYHLNFSKAILENSVTGSETQALVIATLFSITIPLGCFFEIIDYLEGNAPCFLKPTFDCSKGRIKICLCLFSWVFTYVMKSISFVYHVLLIYHFTTINSYHLLVGEGAQVYIVHWQAALPRLLVLRELLSGEVFVNERKASYILYVESVIVLIQRCCCLHLLERSWEQLGPQNS